MKPNNKTPLYIAIAILCLTMLAIWMGSRGWAQVSGPFEGPVSISSMPPVVVASIPPMTLSSNSITGTVTDQYQGSTGVSTPSACDLTARINTNASTIIIAHAAGKTTYVCSYDFSLDLTLSASASLKWGTGTACGSNTAQSSGAITNAVLGLLTNGSKTYGSGVGEVDQSPVAGTSDYCIIIVGGGTVTGSVRYASF